MIKIPKIEEIYLKLQKKERNNMITLFFLAKRNTYFTFDISISPTKGIAFCKLLLISVCR